MELQTAALLSLGFLLLLTGGSDSTEAPPIIPIRLTVELLCNVKSYSTSVEEGGFLVSALRRLQEAQQGFTFTVRKEPPYGLFLVSVNGVAGNVRAHTYWELLSESSGEYTPLNLGISSYIPKANEHIVLRFTTWS